MAFEIEINGSMDANARYISFTPSPCRIRQTPGGAEISLLLSGSGAVPGGGQIVFYSTPGAASQRTLQLTLPSNGGWAEFWLGGRWGYPSIADRDCTLVANGGGQETTIELMVRIRKNANTLLADERDRFLNVWKVLNNGGQGKFQDFRDMHVSAADAEEHRGPHFLPWHRTYLLDLEREMQSVDPSVSLHYWRFDQPAPRVFRSNFMGATRQVPPDTSSSQVTFDPGHPLSGWVTDGTPGILRSAKFDTQTSAAPGIPGFRLRTQAETLALGTVYSMFRKMEGSPHGAAHLSFDGYIDSIPTAAKDPLFFMLHCNVDRLWALWQWTRRRTDPGDTEVYLGQNRDGRRLDDTTWPWNGVITAPRPDFAPRGALAASPTSTAPGTTPTIRSVIDYQGHSNPLAQIGFGYDTVPFEFA